MAAVPEQFERDEQSSESEGTNAEKVDFEQNIGKGDAEASSDNPNSQHSVTTENSQNNAATASDVEHKNATNSDVDPTRTDDVNNKNDVNASDVPPKEGNDASKDPSPEPSTEGVDIFDNDTGNTSLHKAAINLDKKAVLALLQSNASVDRLNFKHRTALHEMTLSYLLLDYFGQAEKRKTFLDILSKLVEHGLDVNDKDKAGKTPLHYVAPYPEHDELVARFLEKDMDPGVTDGLHQTPLHLAVATGSLDTVKLLVEKHSQLMNVQDVCGQTVLHIAAKGKGKAALISYLVRHGAAPNGRDKGGRSPLHLAAKAGRVENVEVLLDSGARIYEFDNSGQSPVHFAAAKDISGKSLACLVPKAGTEILDLQDDVFRQTALHKAIQAQMLENIKVLLRFKPDPNIQDILGETPLHKAHICTEVFVWKYLLSLRGDTNKQNHALLSPYQKALKAKNHTALALMAQFSLHDY